MKKNILLSISILFIINSAIFSQNMGWQKQPSGTSEKLNSITSYSQTYGNDIWIVGDQGTILLNYQPYPFNCTQNLNKIKFNSTGNGFVVGDSGTIILVQSYFKIANLITSNTTNNLRDIAFTNYDSTVIIVGDSGTILKSNVYNINMKIISGITGYNLSSISFTQDGIGWAVGSNGTIIKSTDAGETWTNETSNTTNNLTGVNFFDKDNGWAVGDNGTILYTSDGGKDWHSAYSNFSTEFAGGYFSSNNLKSLINNSVPFQNLQKIYSLVSDSNGTNYFYYNFNNMGEGIKYLSENGSINDYAPKGTESFFSDLKFNRGDTLFAVRNIYAIFYYPQKGSGPTPWVIFPDKSLRITSLDFDSLQNIWASGNKDSLYCITPSKHITYFESKANIGKVRINGEYLYALVHNVDSTDEIWRYKIISSDSISSPELFFSMSEITADTAANIFDYAFNNNNLILCSSLSDVVDIIYPDKSFKPLLRNYYPAWNYGNIEEAYLTLGGKLEKGLYMAFNTQVNSTSYQAYSEIIKISINPLVDLSCWLVGKNGNIITKATGDTLWSEQLSGTNLNLNSINFINDTTGVAVGDSGLILITTNDGITEIKDSEYNNTRKLSDYKLNQNYPNPFNPSTIISYLVPKSSLVTIKVYDVLGREVESLVNEQKNPGNYKIEFNGNKLSSGIYFYRMSVSTLSSQGVQAGSFAETKKLILLK